jgi:hypothetical protein
MQPGIVRTWLRILAVLHILGGLSLPFLLQTPLLDFYRSSNSALLGILPFETAAPAATAFAVGLFGPTIASWGILFLFAVSAAFDHPGRSAWWTLVLAVLAWGPYDAVLSIRHGIYINAVADLAVVLSILVPLVLARSHFFVAPSKG